METCVDLGGIESSYIFKSFSGYKQHIIASSSLRNGNIAIIFYFKAYVAVENHMLWLWHCGIPISVFLFICTNTSLIYNINRNKWASMCRKTHRIGLCEHRKSHSIESLDDASSLKHLMRVKEPERERERERWMEIIMHINVLGKNLISIENYTIYIQCLWNENTWKDIQKMPGHVYTK